MYYIPEPEDKAPGFFVSTGLGLALPNFRGSDSTAESSRYGDVDLDTELGVLWDLQVGYLANPFFGVGLNFHLGVVGSSKREGDLGRRRPGHQGHHGQGHRPRGRLRSGSSTPSAGSSRT